MVLATKPDPLTIMNRIHDDTEIIERDIVPRIIRNSGHNVATITRHRAPKRRED